MAFDKKGFQTLGIMGSPDGTAGSRRCAHTFITNDSASVVEAADYFLSIYKLLKAGDILLASMDNDGTPELREYVVLTAGSGGVTIGRENTRAGQGLQILSFFINLADIAGNGDVLTNYVPGFNFKIEKFDFRVAKPVTTGSKLATLNMEINTTDLTGGTIALTSALATPMGAAIAGAAITGGNVGGPTDSFSIEASGVTAFVEGNGWMIVQLRNLDI